ncbi:MAG: rhodanese-like domain-containing protein [Acutalibacteraceae bacterium]|nr:rhodanese-like domain-containing protein [Acutalibacteraceae bacterium]
MKTKKCLIRIFSFISVIIILIAVCGCQNEEEAMITYRSVSSQEAKELMDTEDSYIILDVRTEEEYEQGHIKNAVLIPDYEIESRAEGELPDKDQLIMVYCRSGRRSKNASAMLISLGYTNIVEFGGIIDWEYDIEK